MRGKFLIVGLTMVVLFGATGCIKLKKDTTAAPTSLGGVFVSDDKGETWKNKSDLMTPGATAGTMSDVDVYVMEADPSDGKALYLGTRANGMYSTMNNGAGWTKVDTLPKGFVRDIAVDPKDKCNIYVAVESRIYKSDDCARTWKQIFYSDLDTKVVATLEIDWFDSKIVYAGLHDGALVRSSDAGKTWQRLKQFSKRVNELVVDPNDSRIVYAGILNVGLFKSVDRGENWEDLTKAMKDFSGAKDFYDFTVSKSPANVVYYASKYGILKSLDAGVTWSELTLLTKKNTETIFSVTVDPKQANTVFYGTDKAVYKSLDGGVNWDVKKMPTTRVAGDILVGADGKRIFMGVKTLEK